MDTAYERYEIVRIAGGFQLFDDESFQRRYTRADNIPLQIGLYVVTWPAWVTVRRFDEHAQFHGPYESPAAARAGLLALQARAARRPLPPLPASRPEEHHAPRDHSFVVPWADG